jgi:alkanesulfonate monooxygenase SsuD/methylene tetrahydromethanopterin reductase-like flavin-dependent oxidoreductase (luciferase family)
MSLLDVSSWGAALATTRPSDEIVKMAQHSEKLGFDSFWLAEVYHWRSSIPIAAAIATSTRRVKIGLGIVPVHTRHPALAAMEAVTLDELSGGRLIFGFGSAKRIAEQHGKYVGPVKAMANALETVRALLDGETVSGDADAAPTKLNLVPPRRIPIIVGCYSFSDQMLKVAGRLSDGVIHVWTNPEWTRHARAVLSDAAAAAGRDPSTVMQGSYLALSVDEDSRKARDAARPMIAMYARIVGEQWRKAKLCRDEDLDAALASGASGVTDRLVEAVAIAGDPAYVVDRVKEFEGTGLTLPIAYGVLGPEPFSGLELLARSLSGRRDASS